MISRHLQSPSRFFRSMRDLRVCTAMCLPGGLVACGPLNCQPSYLVAFASLDWADSNFRFSRCEHHLLFTLC